MFGQVFGGGFAHVANAQAKQETWQGGLLGGFQCRQHVFSRQRGHAVQVGKGNQAQAVKVWQHLDDVPVNQLLHQLVAKAFNFHGTALSKVKNGLLSLRTAEQATGASGVHLALFAGSQAAANWTVRGCGVGGATFGPRAAVRGGAVGVGHNPHHLGNHVARASDDDGVAHTHVFAASLVLVVQRSVGHGHATHEHRGQLGHGSELAGAANLYVDGQDGGQLLLRRVFVGHRPARLTRHEAKRTLQIEPVDLVNRAVDVERQAVALRTEFAVKYQQISSTLRFTGKR